MARSRITAVLLAVSGLALLGSLFLIWGKFTSPGGFVNAFGNDEAVDRLRNGATAWQAFPVWDVLLAACAAYLLATAALAGLGRLPAGVNVLPYLVAPVVAAFGAIYHLASPPSPLGATRVPARLTVDPGAGEWLALVAALLALAALVRAARPRILGGDGSHTRGSAAQAP